MRKPLFTIEIEILYQSLSSDQISQLLSSLVNASPPSTVVSLSITRLSASMLTTSASSTFKIGFMYFIIYPAPLPNPPPNGRELLTGV